MVWCGHFKSLQRVVDSPWSMIGTILPAIESTHMRHCLKKEASIIKDPHLPIMSSSQCYHSIYRVLALTSRPLTQSCQWNAKKITSCSIMVLFSNWVFMHSCVVLFFLQSFSFHCFIVLHVIYV